jgi:hypothetical protein
MYVKVLLLTLGLSFVTPQLAAGKHRPTSTLNHIAVHNFQQNSKQEYLKKIPYRAGYCRQMVEEWVYELSLQQKAA